MRVELGRGGEFKYDLGEPKIGRSAFGPEELTPNQKSPKCASSIKCAVLSTVVWNAPPPASPLMSPVCDTRTVFTVISSGHADLYAKITDIAQ